MTATSRMGMEARAIPERVASALGRQRPTLTAIVERVRSYRPCGVVTVARGSSDHAAEYAIRLVGTRLGLIGTSLAPSLVTLARAPLDFRRHLVVGISQSGRSPDVVETVRAARAGGALTLALVNTPRCPLAEAAELVLAADAGPETAVAATKSYVLSLVQLARLVATWQGDADLLAALARLPTSLGAALAVDAAAAVPILQPAGSAFVVGRGLGLATAREAALKLKEVAGVHAEAVSGAEIMHGPRTLLGPAVPVVLVAGPDLAREPQVETATALAPLAGGLVTVGPVDLGLGLRVATPAAPDPCLQPMVDATALYGLVEAVARARGRDPDRPPHLRKVTETR